MTIETLIPLLRTTPATDILKMAGANRDTFLKFLMTRDAQDILDDLQQKHGREWQAQFVEAISGPDSITEDEIVFLEKYDLGLAFRTVLLPSLPAHLLVFYRRLWRLPRISFQNRKALLREPDVEAARFPDSCIPSESSFVPDAWQTPRSQQLNDVNEQNISQFVEELIWLDITPITILEAIETVTKCIQLKLNKQKLKPEPSNTPRSVSLVFKKDLHNLTDDTSLELVQQLVIECQLNRQIAALLLDWLINIARWKPHLFRLLEAHPTEHGVKLYYTGKDNPDLFDRWRRNATKYETHDPHRPEFKASSNIKDLLHNVKQADRSFNQEDSLGLTYALGRERLFSAI